MADSAAVAVAPDMRFAAPGRPAAGGYGGGGGGGGTAIRSFGYFKSIGGAGGSFGGKGGDSSFVTFGTQNIGTGGGGGGGAVWVAPCSCARVAKPTSTNCTFSNNQAQHGLGGSGGSDGLAGANGQGKGGAIFVMGGATVFVQRLVFTGNSAADAVQSSDRQWGRLRQRRHRHDFPR